MKYEDALARLGLNPDIRLRQMFELGKLAAQAPQQEPVAYAVYHRMGGSKSLHWPEQHSDAGDHNQYQLVPLYPSTPAQRKPLPFNKEDLAELDNSLHLAYKLGWKAAEEAHGIKE